jgi:hypothetical protein
LNLSGFQQVLQQLVAGAWNTLITWDSLTFSLSHGVTRTLFPFLSYVVFRHKRWPSATVEFQKKAFEKHKNIFGGIREMESLRFVFFFWKLLGFWSF